jgi:hypothetical protein
MRNFQGPYRCLRLNCKPKATGYSFDISKETLEYAIVAYGYTPVIGGDRNTVNRGSETLSPKEMK